MHQTQQDGKVSVFPQNSGYLDSGLVFAHLESPYLDGPGATDPANFFGIIHQHGYGTGTPSYVPTLLKVFQLIGNCL